MNGWMGLICLLACIWMVNRAVAGYIFKPWETLALSVILLVAATRFLWVWNREAHEAYSEYMRKQP